MVESNIEFEEIAIRYKLEHLAKLRKDVAMQPISINPRSVSSALVLSFDEVSFPFKPLDDIVRRKIFTSRFRCFSATFQWH